MALRAPAFEIDVYWYYLYNDQDMKEAGEEYAKALKNIQMQLVELDDKQICPDD